MHLVDWDNSVHYDRTGLEEVNATYLDVDIPKVLLPIHPGKNITVIAETIALNQILKIYGHHSAKEFNRRLIDRMKMQEKAHLTRLKLSDYLEKDFDNAQCLYHHSRNNGPMCYTDCQQNYRN